MSWRSGGNSESGSALRRVAEPLAQAIEVELDADDGIVEAEAARGQRVQLADEAERLLARHLDEALAARMQERVVVGRHGDDAAGHADGAQDRLEHALAEEERGGLAGAPPGRAAEAPAHDRAERPRLARQLLALDGVVGVRDLEEREVVAAPGGVARERLEQARQQQRAQVRVLLRERVRDREHRRGAGRPAPRPRRSGVSAGTYESVCASVRPAPRQASATVRRTRWAAVRPPPEPTESSEGTCSSP